jgi:hypothetical protein
MHIGAAVTSGTLYNENVDFGTTEVKKRLTNVLKKIQEFPKLDTIVINLLGDNIDCCGVDGKTARLDHNMPENMDAREQANAFIQIMMWFIDSLVTNKLCSNIKPNIISKIGNRPQTNPNTNRCLCTVDSNTFFIFHLCWNLTLVPSYTYTISHFLLKSKFLSSKSPVASIRHKKRLPKVV